MLFDYYKKFKSLSKTKQRTYIFSAFLVLFLIFNIYIHTPPSKFPLNEIVSIEDGDSLQSIIENLEKSNVIKLPSVFRTTVILLGGERNMKAGDYLLDKKEGPMALAVRFIRGDFSMKEKKITIPEGWDANEIGSYLAESLVNFSKTEFMNLAKGKEGYLFPDTYFIGEKAKPRSVINIMNDTFDSRIKTLSGISTSTYSLNEIITMASILEGEAHNTEDRRIIAGILWKRITVGMPLQVDATFSYINGKGTFDLTLKDLKIDSPYNTYKYKGLPPTPINNPGLDSIFAAMNPVTTKYLYFLTGHNGKMYYARTFDEHLRNKSRYLN